MVKLKSVGSCLQQPAKYPIEKYPSSTYTLPALLDKGCNDYPNSRALNHWKKGQWTSLSNHSFRQQVENIALGLQSLGMRKGDRVALLMASDRSFCLADMACLLAGCVSVPIDLTQTIENIIYILRHSGVPALIVSEQSLLSLVTPFLGDVPRLKWVIVGTTVGWAGSRKIANFSLEELPRWRSLPNGKSLPLQWWELNDVHQQGESLRTAERLTALRDEIAPTDLATIVYVAGDRRESGQLWPKGVMLSHGAIATNILSAFRVYPELGTGDDEVALSFLPLTHIFARSFIYGHLAYGHSIYFSSPKRVIRHLKQVQPTVFITVPRFLEKIYSKILEKGHRLTGWQRSLFAWALKLAQQETGYRHDIGYQIQLALADRLVFSKWRSPFGHRLKALISGGAALDPTVAQVLANAGFPIRQGYGLTETSGVLSYERGRYAQSGTIGLPIPGVEVQIADDGEILVRSPGLMDGYYEGSEFTPSNSPASDGHAPRKPRERTGISPLSKGGLRGVDANGWFHTGDLGKITTEGLLQVTGVKKSLFKLSTGKYVSALALEAEVMRSPLVAGAIAVGANRKFCAMLIWPNLTALRHHMRRLGLEISTTVLIHHPCVLGLYQSLIDRANCHLPDWSTVKRFVLMELPLDVEPFNRAEILHRFAADIDALYAPSRQQWIEADEQLNLSSSDCPLPPFACPVYARSLISTTSNKDKNHV